MHDVFCFSDIHGMYNIYEAIMKYCYQQDENATIIFCGDACDRGPDGYKIMRELLANPHVIYLKGNHEDMFVQAARQIQAKFEFQNTDREHIRTVLKSTSMFDFKYEDIQLSLVNGGMETLIDWIADGMPMDIIERIDNLPCTFSYEQYDFCHSGVVYPSFSRINELEYSGVKPSKADIKYLLWDRCSFGYGWAPGRTLIHGHIPTPVLLHYLEKVSIRVRPYKYHGNFNTKYTGNKIDIDTGVCFTNKLYVLNVLTGKAQGFKIKKNGTVKQIETIQL